MGVDFPASPATAAAAEEGFWRVEPAREFRWVGAGWLCSAVYVTMNIPGSDLFRSTCFRAKQPFELLHL